MRIVGNSETGLKVLCSVLINSEIISSLLHQLFINIVVKNIESGIQSLGSNSSCHFLALRLWMSYFLCLWVSVPICKMGITNGYHRAVMGSNA